MLDGTWVAANGKVAEIEEGRLVTLRPAAGAPAYETAELLGGGTRRLERVTAAGDGRSLVIEGGSEGLGPTYRLTLEGDELRPTVGMGLYDDYDDDLGMPWAFPLLPFRRVAGT